MVGAIENEVQCLLTINKAPHDTLLGAQWPSYRIERGRLEKERTGKSR